ncbi:MAG: hypothetical protein HYV09_28100 [Deltaproteobacteria bacterium]|nr:hypothetical protein [Deltaproteobacteria bacterium]
MLGFVGCGIQSAESALDGGMGHGSDAGVDAPATSTGAGESILDAADAKVPVYVALGSAPTNTAPSDALGWDLRIARTMIATNSGTSGGGGAGVIATSAKSIDEPITCPTAGFAVDAMLPIPGPPGSGEYSGNPALAEWFNYDPATHTVTSKGIVYCVRTANGKYGAIRIRNYTGGKMTVQWRYQPSGSPVL